MYKRSLGEKIFDLFNVLFVGIVALSTLFPLINTLATSLSGSRAILSGEVFIYPVDFTLRAYKNAFEDSELIRAAINSIYLTVVGVFLNLVFSAATAYALSKRRLKIRGAALKMIMFTMIFSGGMIPIYLLMRDLGLLNKYLGLWVTSLISTYYLFVLKTHFDNIPSELEEAALIDGANEIQILVKVVMPISIPVMAALSLFYAVDWWNTYGGIIIYISDKEKWTLMVFLYNLLISITETARAGSGDTAKDIAERAQITAENVRAANVIIALAPILLVYPFLQRYFVKGILIGSIKG